MYLNQKHAYQVQSLFILVLSRELVGLYFCNSAIKTWLLTNFFSPIFFLFYRPQWSHWTSSFLSDGTSNSQQSPESVSEVHDSLIDMEISSQEICVAMLPLWWPLCGLRHPVFGHLLCPWQIYLFHALLSNNAPLHSIDSGEYIYCPIFRREV